MRGNISNIVRQLNSVIAAVGSISPLQPEKPRRFAHGLGILVTLRLPDITIGNMQLPPPPTCALQFTSSAAN